MDKLIDFIKKSDPKTKIIAIALAAVVIVAGILFGGGEDNGDGTDYIPAPAAQTETAGQAEETPAPSEETQQPAVDPPQEDAPQTVITLDENGSYTSKEDVALYIHTYHRLPDNFITKNAARDLGWEGGSLEPYAPGKCIGGDYFGNYEGSLPAADGRKYTECDINTLGMNGRGAERIVFSNDGLIYYTGDHYETFTLLYDDTGTW